MIIIWLPILHYYTRFTGFLAYSFILGKRIKISNMDLLFLSGLLFLMVLHCLLGGLRATILDFRYYWGWLIFYFIFKSNGVSYKTLNSTLFVLSVMTLVEAILVNTIITTSMLPNYVVGDTNDGGYSLAHFGVYQRPYSFGGIAPVGATLLVVLMALCNVRGWRFWFSTLAVLSLSSGTGIFALLLLLLVKYRARLITIALIPLAILLPWFLWFSNEIISFIRTLSGKANSDYVLYLINLLWSTVMSVLGKLDPYMFLIGFPPGHDDVSGHGGDWGILSFISMNGIYGFLLFFLIIFSRVNKANKLPLFIMLLASIHYAAVFSLPGQMLFGLLLSISNSGLPDGNEVSS